MVSQCNVNVANPIQCMYDCQWLNEMSQWLAENG